MSQTLGMLIKMKILCFTRSVNTQPLSLRAKEQELTYPGGADVQEPLTRAFKDSFTSRFGLGLDKDAFLNCNLQGDRVYCMRKNVEALQSPLSVKGHQKR